MFEDKVIWKVRFIGIKLSNLDNGRKNGDVSKLFIKNSKMEKVSLEN